MSKPKQFAWKVVKVQNNELWSAVWSQPLKYKINQWIYPNQKSNIPWLFVFRSRRFARNFCARMQVHCDSERYLYHFKVCKCQVQNASSLSRSHLYRGITREIYPEGFSEGTMFADAVKLIK